MASIPATRFKAQCLELMDRVAERHETYVITKRGRPVAKLVPLEGDAKESIFGWLRAFGSIAGDVLSPAISLRDWQSLTEWEELNAAGERRKTKTAAGKPKKRRSQR